MNNQFIEAHELLLKARKSLRRGDKTSARQLGERAALLAPQMEDVWLVLAAADPDPQDALAYAQKALQINPQSTRAQRAIEWATGRLKQVEALKALTPVSPLPRRVEVAVPQQPARLSNRGGDAHAAGSGKELAAANLINWHWYFVPWVCHFIRSNQSCACLDCKQC